MMRDVQGVPSARSILGRVSPLLDVSAEPIGIGVHALAGAPPRPELAGRRLRIRGRSAVYVVDPTGYRRRVPSRTVYDRIFRGWSGFIHRADAAVLGHKPPLISGPMFGC